MYNTTSISHHKIISKRNFMTRSSRRAPQRRSRSTANLQIVSGPTTWPRDRMTAWLASPYRWPFCFDMPYPLPVTRTTRATRSHRVAATCHVSFGLATSSLWSTAHSQLQLVLRHCLFGCVMTVGNMIWVICFVVAYNSRWFWGLVALTSTYSLRFTFTTKY